MAKDSDEINSDSIIVEYEYSSESDDLEYVAVDHYEALDHYKDITSEVTEDKNQNEARVISNDLIKSRIEIIKGMRSDAVEQTKLVDQLFMESCKTVIVECYQNLLYIFFEE